jgi:xanthine dehydrogenase accessory factor
MKEIIERLLQITEKDEPCVLSTVVETKGSTPQKAGAKLLIQKDGTAQGTLGGGCVEGDMWHLGTQLLQQRGAPLYQKYELNEDFSERGGLVCGGTMHIFIDPIFQNSPVAQFARKIRDAVNGGTPVALATVVKDDTGHVPIGTKILIYENGTTEGEVKNTELVNQIVKIGKILMSSGDVELLRTKDGQEIFIEGYATPPTLVLMGGGHVNKAVSNLARILGFRIYVVDDREEYSNTNRFPEAEEVYVSDFENPLKNVLVNSNTFIVVATRGHRFDDLALAAALKTNARYVGLMGSKRKTILIHQNLLKDGFSEHQIEQVHAPIGLDIGAITPEELALSIMAEIIMVRRGGTGESLKLDKGLLQKLSTKKV